MTRHIPVLPEPPRRQPVAPPPEPPVWLGLAWAAAAWERVWPALWPIAALAGSFAVLALFDLLPNLNGWLHLALLLCFAAAIGVAAWRSLRNIRLPDDDAARRRLERDSGMAHRPLAGLLDRQAGGTLDPASRALWGLHLQRQRAASRLLRVRLPAPGMAAHDPFALRGLIALLLAIGAVGSWGEWSERLGRALDPRFPALAATPAGVDLFVTPPAYTGLAPIYLRSADAARPPEDEAASPVAVPIHSTVMARVTGGGAPPTLQLGSERAAFDSIDGISFEITATVTAGEHIAVTQGGTVLGAWPIRVVPDQPPAAAFTEPPAPTERAVLRLSYRAADDYGIERLAATIRLDPAAPAALPREPLFVEPTLPGQRPRSAEGSGYFDLTPHPWAGQTVAITLEATDGAGQTGHSETVSMVLPERQFTHPVARAIIAQRRILMLEPQRSAEVTEALAALSAHPQEFRDDLVVFLALRSAARRLALTPPEASGPLEAVEPVYRLLWDTALRVEDGDLSLAERELRAAEQALMEALAGDASDREIRQRMDELRAALDRYLQALQSNLMEQMARGEAPPMLPLDPNSTMLDRDQLQELLDRMQQLSESGARDAARQMLSELQSMLENLRTGSPPDSAADNRAMELLEDLQNLTRAQQDLLDQTFQQSQPGQGQGTPQGQGQQSQRQPQFEERSAEVRPGGQPTPGRDGRPGPGSSEDDAANQEALRRVLGELMREIGELTGGVPMPLGRAEQAMRQSEQALGDGRPSQAVPPQTEAVDQLQQGLQGLADQIMEQMAQRNGGMMGMTGRSGLPGRDPLGRPLSNRGSIDSQDVRIPDQADIQRAREILDELRRRFGERSRPALELEYIERLLRRF